MKQNNKALKELIAEIKALPENQSYTERGIPPIFQFREESRILLVGQAPGRKVEESGIPFHDLSGKRLMEWMGISEEIFYGKSISIIPMDFYYPGKGKGGDLPPRPFMRKYHDAVATLLPKVKLRILIGKYAISHYDPKGAKLPLKDLLYPYGEAWGKDPRTNSLLLSGQTSSEILNFPLVHPSPLNYGWINKNPWFMERNVPLLQRMVKELL